MDWGWSQEALLDGSADWRHLTNRIETFMCGGDAAFLSNYFDHLFNYNAEPPVANMGSVKTDAGSPTCPGESTPCLKKTSHVWLAITLL